MGTLHIQARILVGTAFERTNDTLKANKTPYNALHASKSGRNTGFLHGPSDSSSVIAVAQISHAL